MFFRKSIDKSQKTPPPPKLTQNSKEFLGELYHLMRKQMDEERDRFRHLFLEMGEMKNEEGKLTSYIFLGKEALKGLFITPVGEKEVHLNEARRIAKYAHDSEGVLQRNLDFLVKEESEVFELITVDILRHVSSSKTYSVEKWALFLLHFWDL